LKKDEIKIHTVSIKSIRKEYIFLKKSLKKRKIRKNIFLKNFSFKNIIQREMSHQIDVESISIQ